MASIIRLTSTWAAGPRKCRPFADGRERDLSTLIGRRLGVSDAARAARPRPIYNARVTDNSLTGKLQWTNLSRDNVGI